MRRLNSTPGRVDDPDRRDSDADRAPSVEGFRIGELSAKTGVTPEAIRYYEREAVVPPAVRRGAGKYRTYNETDAERLRFVRRARELGFSLDDVRELLELASGDPTRNCNHVSRIARSQLTQVAAKLGQLAALRTELERVIGGCQGVVAVADCRILRALEGEDPAGVEEFWNGTS